MNPGLSKGIRCHEQYLTLTTDCRLLNQAQGRRTVGLVTAFDHSDHSTKVCVNTYMDQHAGDLQV